MLRKELLQQLRENSVFNLDFSGYCLEIEETLPLFEALKTNTSLTSLNLSGSINKFNNFEDASKLSKALKLNSSLKSLSLGGNFIDFEGVIKLSNALKINTSLTFLDLSANDIGNEGAIEVSNALESNSTLTSLDLRGNKITRNGAIKLSELLKSNSSLASLDLTGNAIGNEGATKLSKALKSNTSLTSLNLSENKIRTEGAIKLSEALKLNSSLTSLNLAENYDFGIKGAMKLVEALKSNCYLTDLRNHTDEMEEIWMYTGRNKDIWKHIHEFIRTNNLEQLPSDLLTTWAPSIHLLFPLQFRQVVKAVLMLGAKRQDGTPYYPQTHFYKLPKDVLFLILHYTVFGQLKETEEASKSRSAEEQHESIDNKKRKREDA